MGSLPAPARRTSARVACPAALIALLLSTGCAPTRAILARPVSRTTPAPVVFFAGVGVFDGVADATSSPMDVLVQDGRIASVQPAGTTPAPAGASVVEGRGRTLLPGLIDAHTHIGGGEGVPPWSSRLPSPEAQAAATLYAGVTTVLVPGAGPDTAAFVRELAEGRKAGPRLHYATRPITVVDGHPAPMVRAQSDWPVSSWIIANYFRSVTTPEEARAAVAEELARQPAPFVKVMYDDLPPGSPHLSKAALVAATHEARRLGARTLVHVGSRDDAMDALDAGVAMVMHVPSDGILDDAQVSRIVASGVPLVTTRRLYGVIADVLAGRATFTPLEREVMPPGALEALTHPPPGYRVAGFPDDLPTLLTEWDRTLGENIRRLHRAGATLVAGTDAGVVGLFQGPALQRELASLVELGFTPAEALRAATSLPARLIDPTADYGTLAAGKRADLLLVEGDPLADLTSLGRIAGVWQDGRPVSRGP